MPCREALRSPGSLALPAVESGQLASATTFVSSLRNWNIRTCRHEFVYATTGMPVEVIGTPIPTADRPRIIPFADGIF